VSVVIEGLTKSPRRSSNAVAETKFNFFGKCYWRPESQHLRGEHNITADVEVIPIQKVNEAYDRLLKSDVKYRFSIDMASLKSG
jgi:hypothetical protein